MPKPKVAFYWCAACGGCEEAVVDLAGDLLGVLDAIDIVFWPVAMDFKKRDIEALPDQALFATFLNGAIRTSEQEEMALLLRRKSRHLVAYGACACMGGVPGLANQFSREEMLRFVYDEAPTIGSGGKTRPAVESRNNGHALGLAQLHETVRALDQVVAVDYYLPGCPPTPELTRAALNALLSGNLPSRGAVLAPDIALCDECPRKATKPKDLGFSEFRRPHEILIDAQKCLLAQGLVCCGPATRGGCGALCIAGNMPCTGCFGPTSRVRDQGAKLLSSLCANVSAKDEPAINRTLDGIPDPLGTFYRYALPRSILRRNAAAGATAEVSPP
ncbi:MAG: oxidoreductase [Opitutaceae bacterium]|jgi:F420-non-reducing hydrogenase small subunit